MVVILDGNSGIDAYVWSDLGHYICLRHLFRSKAVTNLIFLNPKITFFLHTCVTYFELPSNITTTTGWPREC